MNKSLNVGLIVVAIIAIIGIPGVAGAFTLGQRGEDVVDLQFMLIEAGYDIPAITSGIARPGYFGPQTQKAYNAYNSGRTLGAVTGPDQYFDYTAVNDVPTFHRRTQMRTATTTACAIQAPRSSTTTLKHFMADFRTGSTTAPFHIELGRSATMNATTTVLAAIDVPANAGVQLAATTSLITNNAILAPGTWLNVNLAPHGGNVNVGTYSPTGSCSAIFVGTAL